MLVSRRCKITQEVFQIIWNSKKLNPLNNSNLSLLIGLWKDIFENSFETKTLMDLRTIRTTICSQRLNLILVQNWCFSMIHYFRSNCQSIFFNFQVLSCNCPHDSRVKYFELGHVSISPHSLWMIIMTARIRL